MSSPDTEFISILGATTGGAEAPPERISSRSIPEVMPILGLGTHLKAKNLPMPSALYFELATWPTINFAYTSRKFPARGSVSHYP